jgi:glycosyltransferase involved in cell wall biosynthesis
MNKKHKVLSICSWYPNDFNPTLGNFTQKHAECISLYNDVITLSIFPDTNSKTHRIQVNEKENLVEIIIYYPKKVKGIKLLNFFLNFITHYKAFNIAFHKVKSRFNLPDIVHLNVIYPLGVWAVWLKFKYKIPYVISEHSSGFHIGSNHSYPKKILTFCKFILKNATMVLPVSENLRKNIELLSPKSKFSIISNVVDEKIFLPNATKNEKDSLKLIHISTGIDEIKNLSGIIRVLEKIKLQNLKITLDIVSDGDIQYAKDLSQKLNLQDIVFFHSTKTTSEIARILAEHDALILFSNYENFPCVIAESFMCGKPVIATNINGIPEHVHKDNGILVEPGDENALYHAIMRFNTEKNNFNSNNIRSYALKNFSYSIVGKKFNQIFDEVLLANRNIN